MNKMEDFFRISHFLDKLFDARLEILVESDNNHDINENVFRVCLKDVIKTLELNNIKHRKLPYIIQDILTTQDFCERYGNWIFAEHEGSIWHFVSMPKDENLISFIHVNKDKSSRRDIKISHETVIFNNIRLDDDEEEEEEDE